MRAHQSSGASSAALRVIAYNIAREALFAGWLPNRKSECAHGSKQMNPLCGVAAREQVRRSGALLLTVAALLLQACNSKEQRLAAEEMTGGNYDRGKEAITRYGCYGCHIIPGIRGANALVGPPLNHMASRMYIAGVLQNTPENMEKWLINPPEVDPLTAMPSVGLTTATARDIASYLYTLK
jgi:cytochrome c